MKFLHKSWCIRSHSSVVYIKKNDNHSHVVWAVRINSVLLRNHLQLCKSSQRSQLFPSLRPLLDVVFISHENAFIRLKLSKAHADINFSTELVEGQWGLNQAIKSTQKSQTFALW